jgi:hydrogenase maturation protease
VGRHILIAGVGYTYLHDWSVGPKVAAQLQGRDFPPGVVVDDWSFGPLDAVHHLRNEQPPFDRVVFFGSQDRGKPAGTVTRHVWSRDELPDTDGIQGAIGESISGVISLDNLVFVCAAFDALPAEVILLEVEPTVDQSFGDGYSTEVEKAIPLLVRYIEDEAGLGESAAPAAQQGQVQ